MASKKLVIIDTDCGVDDALAIMLAAYCQQQGLIDILAITCQFGNTYVDNVCKNVCYTLRACDAYDPKKIPIYRGCDGPIIGKYKSDDYYGKDGLGDSTKDMDPIVPHIETEHAANALVRLAKQHPKLITLIALGPMTNLAMAYMLDNKFYDNLAEIVFMGGTLDFNGNDDPIKEFNIESDVEACSVVLTNAKCPITAVPIECCYSDTLTWDIYDKIVAMVDQSKKAKFVKQVTDMEVKRVKPQPGSKGIVMFDILCVMAPIYPDLIVSKQAFQTNIELNGKLTRGELVFDKRTRPDTVKMDWKSVMYIIHFDQDKSMQLVLDMLK